MIKIDLDGIENYKILASSAKEYLTSTREEIFLIAQNMKNITIDGDSLSQNNPSYTAAALEKKKADIVSDIYSKVHEIDNIITSLSDIDLSCDKYIEDVTSDEDELLKILGVYGDPEAGFEVIDYSVTDDILTFDPANCDYYIKNGTKIYFQIPYDKPTEEKYKIRDVEGGTYVKYLFRCNGEFEDSHENDYSVVLCKVGKSYRIGYISTDDLTPVETDGEGHIISRSNLDDVIEESSGYGIIKNPNDVTVRPFPNSDQGEKTEAKHSSGITYVTKIPYGTPVKIVGQWRNDEQDTRMSYLVSFSNESGNFMGFVDAKDLSVSKDGKDYTKGQDLFPVVTNGTANLICDNNEKRTVPSGTSFRYEGEIDDFYHGTFVENGEIRNAWVPKNASERVMPSSFAKMDDLY